MATVVMNDWLGESGGREGGSQNSRATSDGDKRRARRKVSTPRSLGAFTGRPIHGRVEAASDTRAGLRPAFALRSEPALGEAVHGDTPCGSEVAQVVFSLVSADPPRTTPRSDWHRLEPMLDALLDAAPSERPALLTTLSHGDTALEAELARLVAQCESPHPVLDRPVGENFGDVLYDQEGGFPESLAARYRVSEVIGEGGMAVVYLARDVKHNRDVAVKVIRSEVAATVGRDRFLREIAIVATLQHPHIVSLYDSGDADGSLYYVMPYEEGHSLRDRMRREGPLPIRETVAILRDVCDALAHAHRRGVVHRDIKPENVLLSGEHAMVADFGIARAVHGSADSVATLTGVSVGTPAYMCLLYTSPGPRDSWAS